MHRLWLICGFLLFIKLPAFSQGSLFFVQDPAAGAYEQKGMDPFSAGNNPASIAGFTSPALGLAAERKYGLQGFSIAALSFTIPSSSGSWNLQADYFGFEQYTQTRASLTYARPLGKMLEIGTRFYYHQLRIPGALSAGSFSSDIGMRVLVKPDLVVGWSAFNPLRFRSGFSNPAVLPSVYRLGVGYTPSAQVTLVAETQLEEDRPPALVAGIRYRPVKELMLRLGVHTGTRSPFFSCVFIKNQWQLSFCFSMHP